MTKRQLKNKVYAYEYSVKHENEEHCKRIISELETENFHKLVKLLINGEYQLANEWIENNIK